MIRLKTPSGPTPCPQWCGRAGQCATGGGGVVDKSERDLSLWARLQALLRGSVDSSHKIRNKRHHSTTLPPSTIKWRKRARQEGVRLGPRQLRWQVCCVGLTWAKVQSFPELPKETCDSEEWGPTAGPWVPVYPEHSSVPWALSPPWMDGSLHPMDLQIPML